MLPTAKPKSKNEVENVIHKGFRMEFFSWFASKRLMIVIFYAA